MAPRKKQRPAVVPPPGRELKMRLPEDIAQRIEARAKAQGRPMNRVVINELASIPHLEQIGKLEELVSDLGIVFAKYSGRMRTQELTDALLQAVNDVLASEGAAREAAIDRLRAARGQMMKIAEHEERRGARGEG
jgi:hypothetical protein